MGFTSQDHPPRSGMPDLPVLVLARASYSILYLTRKTFDLNLGFAKGIFAKLQLQLFVNEVQKSKLANN